MNTYQAAYSRTMKLAGLQKHAVNLKQLRNATDALKDSDSTNFVRKSIGTDHMSGAMRPPRKSDEGRRFFQEMGPVTMQHNTRQKTRDLARQRISGAGMDVPDEQLEQIMDQRYPQIENLTRGKDTIFMEGSPGKFTDSHGLTTTQQNLSDPGKEVFNRSVMLHEGAEASPHPGEYGFASHLSLKPMLQDLNIASTLEGAGSDAAGELQNLRTNELDALRELMPEIDRLNLGEERLSRHNIKRLQELYDKRVEEYAENAGQHPVEMGATKFRGD